jgi:hypothetical protein
MGVIGGRLGIRLLNYASRNGTLSALPAIATAYLQTSKIEVLFGPGIWDEIRDKEVLDSHAESGLRQSRS